MFLAPTCVLSEMAISGWLADLLPCETLPDVIGGKLNPDFILAFSTRLGCPGDLVVWLILVGLLGYNWGGVFSSFLMRLVGDFFFNNVGFWRVWLALGMGWFGFVGFVGRLSHFSKLGNFSFFFGNLGAVKFSNLLLRFDTTLPWVGLLLGGCGSKIFVVLL